MNAQEFTNLYSKRKIDDVLTPFEGETGFSLVRFYPEGTQYEKDGRRMFMKVAIIDRGFFYEVNMTKPEKRGETTRYILTDGDKYKKRVTNFICDVESGEFKFNEDLKKIIHAKTKKEFSLNAFVDILATNHLSDRLFWKRKLNSVVSRFLTLFFWLADRHYERMEVSLDRYRMKRDGKTVVEEKKNIEPFFKYFYISKNVLFAALLLTFPTALFFGRLWPYGDFSVSNPTIVLLFFLVLFVCEKFSIWLYEKIKEFFVQEEHVFNKREQNFIEKLHSYQDRNKFNLKI